MYYDVCYDFICYKEKLFVFVQVFVYLYISFTYEYFYLKNISINITTQGIIFQFMKKATACLFVLYIVPFVLLCMGAKKTNVYITIREIMN
jgi:hypothetical protein